MFTTQGGVEIEQVAAESPRRWPGVHVDPLEGVEPHHLRELLESVADPGERAQIAAIAASSTTASSSRDATLCEINPLIVTPAGEVRALDAKVTIDDSSLFRHPDLAEWRDVSAADPLEAFARERGVIYVKLDGSVGILGNGAGLSMSTVDVVVVAGGRAGELLRPRRRRLGRRRRRRARGDRARPAGAVDPLQHLRRASPAATRSPAGYWSPSTGSAWRCRSLSASTARTQPKAGAILADSGRAGVHVEPTMLAAAERAVELAA